MYIRWIGAFRKCGTLAEALQFEIARESVVACEQFKKVSEVRRARVGLLVDPSAVYKNFDHDVWSEYDESGNLYWTRKPWQAHTNHKEAWAEPVYTGLVIKGGGFNNLKPRARKDIRAFIAQTGLPVYKLADGKLKPEKI